MLKTDGIPPRLNNQVCQELLCQQYRYRGKLQQDVDVLLLKVNGRWHQLYFENGTIFWRLQGEAPRVVAAQPDDPLSHPLIDLGEDYGLKECVTKTIGSKASFRATPMLRNKAQCAGNGKPLSSTATLGCNIGVAPFGRTARRPSAALRRFDID